MSSREEFEAWLPSEYPWGNEALDKAFFIGNDDNGYYTGGDFIYDGSSCADALFWAWRGWQESHKRAEAKCAAKDEKLRMINELIDAAEQVNKLAQEDTERLIQERNALAAENAALKESEREFDKMCAEEFGPGWVSEFTEAPTTDAFLAEVRAQGVEMLVKHCERKALEKSYDFFMDAGAVAAQFAAQLRKEAAQ